MAEVTNGPGGHGPRCRLLPPALGRRLLVGGQGSALAAARDEAAAGGPVLAGLADALALAVWEDAPLSGPDAAFVAARQAVRPFLPPALARTVQAVAAATRPPGPDPYFERLAAKRETDRLVRYFLARLAKDPSDVAAARDLVRFAPMAGAFAAAEAALGALPGALAPLGLAAAGELALTAGRAAEAAERLARALAGFPSSAVRFRLGVARLAMGEREAGLAALRRVVAERPWDALALGRFFEAATGRDDRRLPLPGAAVACLYSYQNAARLDRTLAALAASDWRFAPASGAPRLVVLDNGSPDATGAVLDAWRERLGAALSTVRLPVNVGAPAARNWLTGLPEVRRADFVAFLDDDAVVPVDWLGRFGAAVAAFPGAGVYGCLVRGADAPAFVQSADAHLWPTPRPAGELARGFDLLRPWLATADWGQYAIMRPCASVTGCCHLFAAGRLAASGGFDIRFSPSQYDDLDHDLRLLARGLTPVFTGHLAVVHDKATGAASGVGQPGYAAGFANQFKLHQQYDDATLAAMAATAEAALARDTAAKGAFAAEGGPSYWDLDEEGGHGR